MKAFQQNLAKLEAADTQVLGVSMDSWFANKEWAKQIGVEFPLLSDWGGDITRRYGIYEPEYKAPRRVTFVISPEGKIEHIQLDDAAVDPTETITACTRKKLKN
jgi:peroxiredoxin